jgi:hypothetical protein
LEHSLAESLEHCARLLSRGAAALLFVQHFFYGILCCAKEAEAAYLHARSDDEESAKFSLQGQ